MAKRRMCVSIREGLNKPADEISKKYGPAVFMGACLILFAEKNPVFVDMFLSAVEKLKGIKE